MSKSPVLLSSREDYKNEVTDISIILNGKKFELHKDVLIQNSEFFRAMFSSDMLESQRKEVEIKIVELQAFEILINGFYYGYLLLSEENIFYVSEAASILLVTSPLIDQCCNFLQRLINHDHCFEILKFTSIHPIGSVYDSARRYCLIHFLTLCQEESFLDLSLEELKDYVTDEFLVADEYYEILVALKNWTSSNKILLSNEKILEDVVSVCLPAEIQKDVDHLKTITLAVINGDDFQNDKWVSLYVLFLFLS